MAADYVKKRQTPHFRCSGIQKRHVCARLNSATNATISCNILVKIGPVVLAENRSVEIALRVHVVV